MKNLILKLTLSLFLTANINAAFSAYMLLITNSDGTFTTKYFCGERDCDVYLSLAENVDCYDANSTPPHFVYCKNSNTENNNEMPQVKYVGDSTNFTYVNFQIYNSLAIENEVQISAETTYMDLQNASYSLIQNADANLKKSYNVIVNNYLGQKIYSTKIYGNGQRNTLPIKMGSGLCIVYILDEKNNIIYTQKLIK
jgi:hypothetical protein